MVNLGFWNKGVPDEVLNPKLVFLILLSKFVGFKVF